MERWNNRVAVVTGASSGIGAQIAKDLVKAGLIVVAAARREERLEEIAKELPAQLRDKFHYRKLDVTDESGVQKFFEWVDTTFGHIDVLVNNAGVLRQTTLVQPENGDDMRSTVETNILGVVYSTREAFNLMRARGIDDGHIFVISSYSGHVTPNLGEAFPSFNIYSATKHAIRSMIETYRQDFLRAKTKIKITALSPGVVNTDIFPDVMDNIVKNHLPMLQCEDVSNALLYALATPPHVQIHDIIIKPIGEMA